MHSAHIVFVCVWEMLKTFMWIWLREVSESLELAELSEVKKKCTAEWKMWQYDIELGFFTSFVWEGTLQDFENIS